MNPNQPGPAPQAPAPNPYDFLNSPKPVKKPILAADSMKSRIIVVAVGIGLLAVIAIIFAAILSATGGSSTKALKSLVTQQAELVRIAERGAAEAKDSTNKSFAITTQFAITSQQQKVAAYLAGEGATVSKEELAASQNKKTDEVLTTAAASNRFDEAMRAELDTQLRAYLGALKSAHDGTSNEKTRRLLSESYTSAATLLDL